MRPVNGREDEKQSEQLGVSTASEKWTAALLALETVQNILIITDYNSGFPLLQVEATHHCGLLTQGASLLFLFLLFPFGMLFNTFLFFIFSSRFLISEFLLQFLFFFYVRPNCLTHWSAFHYIMNSFPGKAYYRWKSKYTILMILEPSSSDSIAWIATAEFMRELSIQNSLICLVAFFKLPVS